jgi:quercetin dioxygenase-like cupin family protein
MRTVNLDHLQKVLFGQQGDDTARVSGIFPLSAATGNKSTALVYFELEPGKKVPSHTDSAEEVLLILGGRVQTMVDNEKGEASEGTLVVVPAMEPHSVRNIGTDTARVVGFFSSNTVMSTFDEPLLPVDADAPSQNVRTVVTPFPGLLETELVSQ